MILYFSATGNNQYVAETIARETNDTLVLLKTLVRDNIKALTIHDGEDFGVIMPCYWGTIPSILTDYLKDCQIMVEGDHHYMYMIGTYGAHAGRVCSEAQKAFQSHDIVFDSTYTIRMVDNWNPHFFMTEAFIAEEEAYTQKELPVVVDAVRMKKKGLFAIETQSLQTLQEHKEAYERMRTTDRFTVDEERCIGCGLCSRQCPLQVIAMRDQKPCWDKDMCTLCLGCVHRCPVNAIHFNHQTEGHGQYINPHVKLDI